MRRREVSAWGPVTHNATVTRVQSDYTRSPGDARLSSTHCASSSAVSLAFPRAPTEAGDGFEPATFGLGKRPDEPASRYVKGKRVLTGSNTPGRRHQCVGCSVG